MFGLEPTCRITNTAGSNNRFSIFERFIGDRSIHEKDFGRIQIDRVFEMEKWAENVKAVQDERVKLSIIAANRLTRNH